MWFSFNNLISGNTADYNYLYGIFLDYSDGNTGSGNNLSFNASGPIFDIGYGNYIGYTE